MRRHERKEPKLNIAASLAGNQKSKIIKLRHPGTKKRIR